MDALAAGLGFTNPSLSHTFFHYTCIWLLESKRCRAHLNPAETQPRTTRLTEPRFNAHVPVHKLVWYIKCSTCCSSLERCSERSPFYAILSTYTHHVWAHIRTRLLLTIVTVGSSLRNHMPMRPSELHVSARASRCPPSRPIKVAY